MKMNAGIVMVAAIVAAFCIGAAMYPMVLNADNSTEIEIGVEENNEEVPLLPNGEMPPKMEGDGNFVGPQNGQMPELPEMENGEMPELPDFQNGDNQMGPGMEIEMQYFTTEDGVEVPLLLDGSMPPKTEDGSLPPMMDGQMGPGMDFQNDDNQMGPQMNGGMQNQGMPGMEIEMQYFTTEDGVEVPLLPDGSMPPKTDGEMPELPDFQNGDNQMGPQMNGGMQNQGMPGMDFQNGNSQMGPQMN